MLKWGERELQIRISKRLARTRKKRTNQCAQRCVCIYEMYRGLKTEKKLKGERYDKQKCDSEKKNTQRKQTNGEKKTDLTIARTTNN